MKRFTCKLTVAAILIGLIAWLPLRTLRVRPSVSRQGANNPTIALPALQGEPAIQRLKEEGLYDSLQQAVQATRYEMRWEERPALGHLPPSYYAPNPAQSLNAYFRSQGLHLSPQRTNHKATDMQRASDQPEWQAEMNLIGYGYGESLSLVGPAELAAQDNRIEYRRTGLPLTEWYINKAEGLEQGFTIEVPPEIKREGERLRLALELNGDLRAELTEKGDAIVLKQQDGQVALRYTDLYAYDAKGQTLPSEMKVSGRRVMLEVEESGAVYPVTIDPLFTKQTKFVASDGAADDLFGIAVAISEDTVVVGAPGADVGSNTNQGSAYVFARKDGKTWNQWKLTASDGAAEDRFGSSVAISGEKIVVGAWGDDFTTWSSFEGIGSNVDQGSAYVFVRSGTTGTWTEQQKLIASDGAALDYFGCSVAIGGSVIETIVVGAWGDNIGTNPDQGSAYVFVRSGTSWIQHQQKLTANDGELNDRFGVSVAMSGDRIVVGAPEDFVGSNSSQGSAYVFLRNTFGTFSQQKLTAGDGAIGDRFGVEVAISGETVVVGAWCDDIGSNADQGSVYVFVRSGAAWSEQQKLTASDGAADDLFGVSVAISGETLVVGADRDDTGSNTSQGSAYVFVRSGSSWSQQDKLTASDAAADDLFGVAVAISMNVVVVGADRDDIGANAQQGSAYMFSIWSQQQKLTASDGADLDRFGGSVAIDKDTAVVGAYNDDIGSNVNQGSAYVFVRSGSSWLLRKLTASDGAGGDLFGISVAINGDTVVVGAQADDIGFNLNQGSAYVFRRSTTTGPWTEQQKLIASDGAANDYFGNSVAISDDTIVVGAAWADIGSNADQGSAYVFARSRTTGIWSQQQKLTASDGATLDQFGVSVAIHGQTIAVGAYSADVGSNANQGAVYVFVRSGTTWSDQQKLTASNGMAHDNFGRSVGISGETIIVGAPYYPFLPNPLRGSAYVFVRNGTTWSQQQKLTPSDGAAGDRFGVSVGISGNTVVVGASLDAVGSNVDQGSAYVFVRSGTSWSQQQKSTACDGAVGDEFGASVAISGNTVVVGAAYDNIVSNLELGSAYIFVR